MIDDRKLWKHLDGELPAAESQRLDADAARDPRLARLLAEMREIAAAVRAGVPKPPAGFAEGVVARALAEPGAPVLDIEEARRFLRRILVAASLFAALGLAYLAVEIVPRLVETPLLADRLGK